MNERNHDAVDDEDLDPPVDETDFGPQPVIIIRDANDEPRNTNAEPSD